MKIQRKAIKKLVSLSLAILLTIGTLGSMALATTAESATPKFFDIANPYANVNWNSFGQYNAALHWHTWNSDGSTTLANMVETHYTQGYDIAAAFDHDYVTAEWDINGFGRGVGNNNPGLLERNGLPMLMTTERRLEIEAGVGRDGKGMINITNTNEQSSTQHLNTLWAPFNNWARGSTPVDTQMRNIFTRAEELGGLSFINHPGRETGGSAGGNSGANGSRNHAQRYINLFMSYSVKSLVGMEIMNRLDNESRSDRILWDYILSTTMPQGRPVWGISNDDAHSMIEVGYNNNIMLMSALTQEDFRTSLETGAFYATAPVARREGVNATFPNGTAMRSGGGNATTEYLRGLDMLPSISNITVSGNTITITGAQYEVVEWVSGIEYVNNVPQSRVIATGNSIDVSEFAELMAETGYVRAHLKSSNGIAFTNPFGVSEATIRSTVPTASVRQVPGNTNFLTVNVTETYSNGMTNVLTNTIEIRNNASGTYEVGSYRVFVNTQGNTQIREIFVAK